jgi:23S rRNA pseudouridine1911/1915/1917 synthase
MKHYTQKYYDFNISNHESGLRLDKFLAQQLPDISRSKLQHSIKESKVFINGAVVTICNHKVRLDDNIRLDFMEDTEQKLECIKMPLNIVYEDEFLLIIDKPVGLTVHPGAGTNGHATLVHGLLDYCKLSNMGSERPGIVHRIDKDTSGLLVVAKDDQTHYAMTKLIANRELVREYFAIIYGGFNIRVGMVEANIGRNQRNRKLMAIDQRNGRHALTKYEVLKEYGDRAVSSIKCKLETGRTHQIRVHMLHKGCPIVGDQSYGRSRNHNLSGLSVEAMAAIRALRRQALHAARIAFVHPVTGEEINVQSPLPYDISRVLELIETGNV